ncbi:hypothetical protein WJX84_005166, partial [Apatococcus fuscideae]
AEEQELQSFELQCLRLASLATIAGAPQVVLPVTLPGRPAMGISLIGMPRTDLQLLEAAAGLEKLLQPTLEAVLEKRQQAAARAGTPPAPAASSHSSSSSHGQSRTQNGRHAAAGSQAQQPGEGAKAEGNTAFSAGNFDEAVLCYSRAIQADSSNPVYYSNRAMAHLKAMRFEDAESDCNLALKLDSVSAKALLRRGVARMGLSKYELARKDFHQVVALEPKNRQARGELENLKHLEASGVLAGSGPIPEDAESIPNGF